MSKELIALLAAVLGALLTVIGKIITANSSSSTTDRINFRESLMKRVRELEARQAEADTRQNELEKNIQTWTLRYWALYKWMVRFCIKNNLDIMPPTFHEMEPDEIRETVAEKMKKKTNFTSQTSE